MKILVTGGAGFIGSEMVRQLAQTSHDVYVLDSLTYAGNYAAIEPVLDPDHFAEIDIRDSSDVSQYFALNQFDSVVNFAAETHVDNSIRNPEIFLETNVLGTLNLLEEARKHDFKFLQISTDEVYGSIREGEFSEQDKLDPSSPYSASKAAAELLLQSYIKTYSVNGLGVRCSNNYGHFQNAEKLIPTLIRKTIRGEKLPIYGSGKNVREWIHVSDSVQGILNVLNHGEIGEFYNISSSEFLENLDVARKIIQYFGGDDDCIEFVQDRLGHDFRYAIDSTKIRRELGWKPLVTFEKGLSETIKWYIENPDYLEERTLP
jgi:dTDP-glucose 4,6-dehydratase